MQAFSRPNNVILLCLLGVKEKTGEQIDGRDKWQHQAHVAHKLLPGICSMLEFAARRPTALS